MLARFTSWLKENISLKAAAILLAFCLLFAASFAVGAFMGRRNILSRGMPIQPPPQNQQFAPPRGTFGAIDEINGNQILLRDPRTGRTWIVRAGINTVIEFGRRQRIPFNNLRVGQRVFVVGVPDSVNAPNEYDAQFIGVVLGQPQKFIKPAVQPMSCWDCAD